MFPNSMDENVGNGATILPNEHGTLFEVWEDGEVMFTDADKITCYQWASEHGYIVN